MHKRIFTVTGHPTVGIATFDELKDFRVIVSCDYNFNPTAVLRILAETLASLGHYMYRYTTPVEAYAILTSDGDNCVCKLIANYTPVHDADACMIISTEQIALVDGVGTNEAKRDANGEEMRKIVGL